eukprot:32897-Rhodomonas_salina.1
MAGYKATFSADTDEEVVTFKSEDNFFTFQLLDDDITLLPTASLLKKDSSKVRHTFQFHGSGCVNLEELVHITMGHPGQHIFEHLNMSMDGLPRKLLKENFEVCPASCCMDAKAIKNPYPPVSTHLDGSDISMWQWDLVDM